ncbi:MAG: hypothetical protein IH790_06505, partial [Acidobacteria bacterium]|nr:hypothetical protein [Acidobacteriota bacterium]
PNLGRCAVKVRFSRGARDFGEQLTISAAHLRLIAWPQGKEKPYVSFPVSWTQEIKGGGLGTFLFDDRSHYITSVPGREAADVLIVFPFPAELEPRFIQIKGTRYDLPQAQELMRQECEAVVSGMGETSLTVGPLPDFAGARPIDDADISLSSSIRPVTVSSNQLPGTMKESNKYLVSGDALFKTGRARVSRALRIKGIDEPQAEALQKIFQITTVREMVNHPEIDWVWRTFSAYRAGLQRDLPADAGEHVEADWLERSCGEWLSSPVNTLKALTTEDVLLLASTLQCVTVRNLATDTAIRHWKADGLDLTPILTPAQKPHDQVEVYCTTSQDHALDKALDNELIKRCKKAIEKGKEVRLEMPIRNINRTVGTMLSHEIAKRWGEESLPDGTIHIRFNGSAGQSLGAWLVKGVTLELEGDANDYVGKGLSGGRLIIYPPRTSRFLPEENVIVGNVVLYGATGGEAYFRGRAAERFCVRNSGARAVIEGVGDHGCEYMTGGRVVILGPTGRNFAAGMSGGIAYVWDTASDFKENCNLEMVELEGLEDEEEIAELRELIERHQQYTGSTVAEKVLEQWESVLPQFVKVMPTDYKRFMEEQEQQQGVEAVA